jgi:hypothetical protein
MLIPLTTVAICSLIIVGRPRSSFMAFVGLCFGRGGFDMDDEKLKKDFERLKTSAIRSSEAVERAQSALGPLL